MGRPILCRFNKQQMSTASSNLVAAPHDIADEAHARHQHGKRSGLGYRVGGKRSSTLKVLGRMLKALLIDCIVAATSFTKSVELTLNSQ